MEQTERDREELQRRRARDEYRRDVSDGIGEARWTFWKVFAPFLGLIAILGVVGYGLGWFGEAAQVAQEQFGPRAALEKYEWFVDQANGIEKMDRDVALFRGRVDAVKTQYAGYGEDMTKWPPDVRVMYNNAAQQARDDLAAVASQRNTLVRDYNAQSEKFNWSAFDSRSDKPKSRYEELSP